MYHKPVLQRFGTLRELTLIGWGPDGDGGFLGYIDGCQFIATGNCRS